MDVLPTPISLDAHLHVFHANFVYQDGVHK